MWIERLDTHSKLFVTDHSYSQAANAVVISHLTSSKGYL